MKGLSFLFGFALVIGIFVLALAFIFGSQIPPGSMGIKQILVGTDQGYDTVALNPGFHGSVPFRSKIHVVPANVQIVPIIREGYKAVGKDGLDITTSDGNYVSVGASAVYTLYKMPNVDGGQNGGPADLVGRLGINPSAWKMQVISIASDKLLRSLSQLSASEFYNPQKRQDKFEEAESECRKSLSEFGIKLENLFLDHYSYVDSKIDEAIFRKNMQSQEEHLNEQKSKLSEASAKLEQVSAEWDAKLESLRVEGRNRSLVIRSEADLYEKKKQAEADLNYSKSQAEVDRLKAQILTNSQSADVYVARQMTPLVSSIKGGIVQSIDPYNLESWSEKLGVTTK